MQMWLSTHGENGGLPVSARLSLFIFQTYAECNIFSQKQWKPLLTKKKVNLQRNIPQTTNPFMLFFLFFVFYSITDIKIHTTAISLIFEIAPQLLENPRSKSCRCVWPFNTRHQQHTQRWSDCLAVSTWVQQTFG